MSLELKGADPFSINCEVLVVGGGPAGSIAAKFLAEYGKDTILVEKNFSFDKPCGGGIPSAGLEDIGIFDEIAKNLPFNRVKRVKIVPPFSEPIELNLQGGDILIFERRIFDSFLRKLAQQSGAVLIEGEIKDVILNGKTLKSVIKKRDGGILEITSKYIVAADGVNSKLCELVNIPKPDYFWTVSLHLTNEYQIDRECCEFWFGSSHASFFYSWVFPAKQYISVGTGSEDARKLKNLIENFLKKRFTDSIQLESLKLRAYKIPRWKKRDFFKNNILFCGDALGTVMPVSFEGIYYSMKSAQFAAEAIVEGNIKNYEKRWNERFTRQFSIMKKFQDIMFGNDKKMDQWLNIHRNPAIQEIAMALWLRKEKGKKLIPLYIKAFTSFIAEFTASHVKIKM